MEVDLAEAQTKVEVAQTEIDLEEAVTEEVAAA
jgi:hypothetical protein